MRPANGGAGIAGPLAMPTAAQQDKAASSAAEPTAGYGKGPAYCTKYAGGMASPYQFGDVYACEGTTTGSTAFDDPKRSDYAWQCVELSARYLWAIHGVWAGPGTGFQYGYQLVSNVHSRYPSIPVGIPGPGSVPAAGDVISLGPGGATDPVAGHTAVVISSNPSTGSFEVMSENFPDFPAPKAGVQQGQVDLSGGHNHYVKFANDSAWTTKACWLKLATANPPTLACDDSGSGPRAVVTPNGNIDVFWRGADGHLWHEWYLNGSPPSWNGPAEFTNSGTLGSDPHPVATPNGNIDVFWRGTDNNLWHAWYLNGSPPSWNGPAELTTGGLLA
jgi:CHAP domain